MKFLSRYKRWSSTSVPLTIQSYPIYKRNPKYKTLSNQDLEFFSSVCSMTQQDVESFNIDWTRKYRGQSQCVLKPKTSLQVSKILEYCHLNSIAIVPQGGNTGLVGGSVPVFDEVILSTANMNQIEDFDEFAGILTCQSGCILENLESFLNQKGYLMPLDLGSKGTCQIGGNLGTNAGGQRLARYGSLHGTVLSLQVVVPNGQILDLGKPLRKDNTGYDLKHLFIGSEGTLGVITKVSILTPKKSKAIQVCKFDLILPCIISNILL